MKSSTLWFAELLLHFIKVKTLVTIKTVTIILCTIMKKAKLLTSSLLESRRWAPGHRQWEIAGHDSLWEQWLPQALQDFLDAQQMKAPEKGYSNWLFMGHVPVFPSSVPVPSCSWLTVCVSSWKAIGRLCCLKEYKNERGGGRKAENNGYSAK